METLEQAYAVLGLEPSATTEEVENAYRRAIRRYPPELNQRRFARIKQAYELLSSFGRRMALIDRDLAHGIDLLYPPVHIELADPPDPPPPLSPADWEPFLGPLRERAVQAVLKSIGKAPPARKRASSRQSTRS
jgi:curved DNA-binding protein CbpA